MLFQLRRLAVPGVFLAAISAYVLTLCPSVYVEGSGELIGATWWLGTPHPTGYPVYVLLGRLLAAAVPFASPAKAVNAATALMSAAAAAALCQLLLYRGCGAAAAIGGGLALAFSQTFWSQAVIAEVYGLMGLAAILVVGVCLRAGRGPDRDRWLLLAGYVAGLGVTCHLQIVLLLPPAVASAVLGTGARLDWGRLARDAGRLGAGLVAALSVWLYLPVRNGVGPGFHWGPLDTTGRMWDHVSGVLYRPSFFSLPLPALTANLERLGDQLAQEWTPLLLPVVAWGAVVAWRRDRPLAAVIAGAAVLNMATALGYQRDPAGASVFFLLSIVSASVCIGYGLDDLRLRLHSHLGPVFASAAVAGCGVAVGAANVTEADHSDAWLPDRYGRRLLAELPAAALLLTDGDDASYLLDYLHRVEGVRPDVVLHNRIGRGDASPAGDAAASDARRRTETRWLDSGRAVHFLVARHIPRDGYRFAPWGLSYRVVADTTSAATGPEIDPTEILGDAEPSRDPWVQKLVANCWYQLGERHREAGSLAEAASAYERAAEAAPRSQSTNHNVSLNLLRMNKLESSLKYAMAALEMDPARPGPYRLAAEILSRLGRTQELDHLHKRARYWSQFP